MNRGWFQHDPSDTTDPAFAAHVLPIFYWAQAIWDGLCARDAMAGDFARSNGRLVKVRHVWSAVTGPAGAFIASATRLGWTTIAFNHVRDDLGQ